MFSHSANNISGCAASKKVQNILFSHFTGLLVGLWSLAYDKFDLGTVLGFIGQLISNLELMRRKSCVLVRNAKYITGPN